MSSHFLYLSECFFSFFLDINKNFWKKNNGWFELFLTFFFKILLFFNYFYSCLWNKIYRHPTPYFPTIFKIPYFESFFQTISETMANESHSIWNENPETYFTVKLVYSAFVTLIYPFAHYCVLAKSPKSFGLLKWIIYVHCIWLVWALLFGVSSVGEIVWNC